jgi:hypothetical protein
MTTCEATGLVVALQVGIDVQFIVNSAGKSVFTVRVRTASGGIILGTYTFSVTTS